WRGQARYFPWGRAPPAPVSQQLGGELPPAYPSAGAAHARVQVHRTRATVSLRLWTHCPTLPTAPAALVQPRVPAREEAKMAELEGQHGHGDSSLRAESVRKRSALVLLLSCDDLRIGKLSTPSRGVCTLGVVGATGRSPTPAPGGWSCALPAAGGRSRACQAWSDGP